MPKINGPTLAAHRAQMRDALLDAWATLVAERGYDDVSLSNVAAAAGLARTAVYNYFPDREALLFSWTARLVAQTVAALEEQVGAAATPAERLEAFVRVELESFATARLLAPREPPHLLGPKGVATFLERIAPVEQALQAVLADGREAGVFDGFDDPGEVSPMVLAVIGAERGPVQAGRHPVPETTARVTSFLLRALGTS